MHDWLDSPTGRYLRDWEQNQFDRALADVFGFHALQLGLPQIDALRTNRMPHRWLGCDRLPHAWPLGRGVLLTHSVALPFADASLDLVVMPHTLELSLDPHATLREVERVLVPEGRLVISGFNPASLWGLRQRMGQGVPEVGGLIGPWRLRDWLQLLSFEVQTSSFGCYRPVARTETWLQRFAWLDRAGQRWWPILGAAYCIEAVKRVRGMRLMEPVWKRPSASKARAVSTASKGAASQGME